MCLVCVRENSGLPSLLSWRKPEITSERVKYCRRITTKTWCHNPCLTVAGHVVVCTMATDDEHTNAHLVKCVEIRLDRLQWIDKWERMNLVHVGAHLKRRKGWTWFRISVFILEYKTLLITFDNPPIIPEKVELSIFLFHGWHQGVT